MNNSRFTVRILISTWLVASLIISMFLKNETLASLLATRDNNIDSINDLMTTNMNGFILENSQFYNGFIKKHVKNHKNIFKPVNHNDIYSEESFIQILQGTHALIYVETKLKHIHMINYKYPLHLSKSRLYLLLRGFIMKKSIDKTIEEKIKKAFKLFNFKLIYFYYF